MAKLSTSFTCSKHKGYISEVNYMSKAGKCGRNAGIPVAAKKPCL